MNPNAVLLDTSHSLHAHLKSIPINNIILGDGFWHTRQQLNQSVTIPTQFQLLEQTGRLDNFRRVTGEVHKPYQGYVFNDSDVYKWLEAASWSLVYQPDGELRQQVNQVISMIIKAQDKDGYLNTYFSLEKIRVRWMNLQEKHELYCAGHLIQAAIAHHRVTGEDQLMNIAISLANHICTTFGPSQVSGSCGHPEIEMSMVELFRETGDDRYLTQAAIFIERRGRGYLGKKEYLLDHTPFRQMDHLVGHAVRALYLCSGATDLALETGEGQLVQTLERLWETMVAQQMYITGGVGSRYEGEAFGKLYELPNARAYAETCAAIANVMWNWRMLQMGGNARYADLMEWALYNAVLPGISLDARDYFYINPLRDDGSHRRQEWFDCACCPPNIARTLAALPGYMYSVSEEGIWVHLYAQSKATLDLSTGQQVTLDQTTSYPWAGQVTLSITEVSTPDHSRDSALPPNLFSLILRLPGWIGGRNVMVKINGKSFRHQNKPGSYLKIQRQWKPGDKVELDLPMDIQFIESHPSVEENHGRIAISRGPLVYCLEAVDNPKVSPGEVRINPSYTAESEYDPKLLGGMVRLHLEGYIRQIDPAWGQALYQQIHPSKGHVRERAIKLITIPYFAWANRKPGAMAIWHLMH